MKARTRRQVRRLRRADVIVALAGSFVLGSCADQGNLITDSGAFGDVGIPADGGPPSEGGASTDAGLIDASFDSGFFDAGGDDAQEADAAATLAWVPGTDLCDDINPDWDGNVGRWPLSPHAIAPGFPTPFTVGLVALGMADPATCEPYPGVLTPTSGRRIMEDGAIIEGEEISGSLNVLANDVTIRNSRITATDAGYGIQQMPGFSGLTIENTRVRLVGHNGIGSHVIKNRGGAMLITGSDLSGGSDGVSPGTVGFRIENTVIRGLMRGPAGDSGDFTHNDGIQQFVGGEGPFEVVGCTIIAPYRMSTSALLFQNPGGDPTSGVLVQDTYLSGGSYSIYTRQDTPPMRGRVTGIVVEEESSAVWDQGGAGRDRLTGLRSDSTGGNVVYSENHSYHGATGVLTPGI